MTNVSAVFSIVFFISLCFAFSTLMFDPNMSDTQIAKKIEDQLIEKDLSTSQQIAAYPPKQESTFQKIRNKVFGEGSFIDKTLATATFLWKFLTFDLVVKGTEQQIPLLVRSIFIIPIYSSIAYIILTSIPLIGRGGS
jgi:hypothetical protein